MRVGSPRVQQRESARPRSKKVLASHWSAAAVAAFVCFFSLSLSHLPKLGELELQLFQGLVSRDVLRGVAGLAL